MRNVAARWIPKLLHSEQKKSRVKVCRNVSHQYHALEEQSINIIETVDETWISLFDPETKRKAHMFG